MTHLTVVVPNKMILTKAISAQNFRIIIIREIYGDIGGGGVGTNGGAGGGAGGGVGGGAGGGASGTLVVPIVYVLAYYKYLTTFCISHTYFWN